MKLTILAALVFIAATGAAFADDPVLPSPNGITMPAGYKDWRMISPSHRGDNNTLRVILGNDIAIEAARSGKMNPWPDGSIMAKLVWKDAVHPNWASATVPGEFLVAEFMIKDSKQYEATGGWGFARWLGMEQKPYGKDASFVQECFACHTPVKKNDYVFTHPAQLPSTTKNSRFDSGRSGIFQR